MKSNHEGKKESDINNFRFVKFSERIAKINVNVVHRLGLQKDLPEDADTFFYEALVKWEDLNCTQSYENFKKECGRDVITLTQLVHNEQRVVQCLQKHLNVINSNAYQPLLELVVALARDLQADFYVHFPQFFTVIVELLQTRDPDVIEHAFTCISYLFKFLWRYMIKDIAAVYKLYSPLLTAKRPVHITNFACESISFLLRKVHDKSALLDLIFLSLDTNPEYSFGVGQLLFEVNRGVKSRFHSCVEQVLPCILSKLGFGLSKCGEGLVPLPWDHVLPAQLQMMKSFAEYTTKEFSKPVWTILLDTVESLMNELNNVDASDEVTRKLVSQHLERVLSLFNYFVSFKRGSLIVSYDKIITMTIALMKQIELSDECGSCLASIVAVLLASYHSHLDVTTTGRLVTLVYRSSYSREVKWEFTRKVLPLKMFLKDVLPTCLAYCMELMQSSDSETRATILSFIVEILTYFCPSPMTGEEFDVSGKITLDFSVAAKWASGNKEDTLTFPLYLESIFTDLSDSDIHENSCLLWAAIFCIPHLKLAINSPLLTYVKKLASKIFNILKKSVCYNKLVIILSQCVETFAYCAGFDEILPFLGPSAIKELLKLYADNVHVLRLVDLYLTAASTGNNSVDFLTDEYFQSIFHHLFPNIASPYHQVKLLTLRICNAFPFEVPQSDDKDFDGRHLFEICLLAEKGELSYQKYRERLQFLQKLEFDLVQNCIPVGPYKTVPIKYLIGTLYVNFQLFWEPCMKIISSHAAGMDLDEFWAVYYDHLQKAASYEDRSWNNDAEHVDSPLNICFYDLETRVANLSEKPDLSNVRFLLWKAMSSFPHVVEAKSRELSNMLLDLVGDGDSVKQFDVEMELEAIEENYDLEEEDDDDVTAMDDASCKDIIKVSNKIFAAHLELFAKFKNPKTFHHKEKLYSLYTRLLSHKSQTIQRLAVDCIMTYNHEFLTPYKANIYRVINDNTFRSEIILFSVDTENGVVLAEHRSGLIPILMRILYVKMNTKPSVKTKGKGKSFSRQSIILNFLSGCTADELKFFLDLNFQSFKRYLHEDIDVLAAKTLANRALVHSIGHLTRSIKLLELIFKKLAHQIENLLPWLLKLFVYQSLTILSALENRYKVKRSLAKSFKTLQKLCLEIITQFFISFENYPFSSEEIDAIFTAFVWPKISRLTCEGSVWLKQLLKLFSVWSENPRFFVLLGKHLPNDPSTSPLQKLLELYSAKRVLMNVTPTVMGILERLLTLEDYVADNTSESSDAQSGTVIEVRDCCVASRDQFLNLEVPPNFGTLLVFPHISLIIKRMRMTIKNLSNKQNGHVPKGLLHILSRLGELMTDPKQNRDMIAILLPLVKKTEHNDQGAILVTVENFMKNVEAPEEFLKTVTQLYAFLENHDARICLDRIMQIISRNCKRYKNVATVCQKLNAWSLKRAGEPDYVARLDGFSAANKLLEEIEILDPDLIFMIIQNCFYTINIVDDLALKASASDFLVKLAGKLGKIQNDQEAAVKTICGVLIEEILKHVKNDNESQRREYLGLLSALVRNCRTVSPFDELVLLTDPDPEQDFFENINHIQVNMQSRALLKLAEGSLCEKLSTDILINYILPLAKYYLFNENFIKKNAIVDAAVAVLGKICQHLNWSDYVAILKQYLEKMASEMRYHKTVVKVIVAILDAFHFDLSKSKALTKKDKWGKPAGSVAKMDSAIDEPNLVSFLPLNEDEATAIHNTVAQVIFPKLQNCLMQKAKGDGRHKMSGRKYYAEDDEILRVPMAIAMVKLLKVLPKGLLDQYIPGIFLKLCEFLRSKAITIREKARETLVIIMQSLGKRYLIYLIEEMNSSMTRGYQFHVLTYTIHKIMVNLRELLIGGDLDPCITVLTEICHKEIFGEVAVEKKIGKITEKTQEAQHTYGFSLYRFMGRFVSSSAITDLLLPLKEKLSSTQSYIIIRKVRTCLDCVIEGLALNQSMSSESLFIFAHAIMTESIPEFTKDNDMEAPKPAKLDPRLQPSDTYLIPSEPVRGGKPANTSIKTNAHILVEFGLKLLLSELKRCKLAKADVATLQMLDPFLNHMMDCFESKHVKCITVALQNLALLLRRPLPSVKTSVNRLSIGLFALLKKYGAPGMVQSVNSYLVVNIFQVLTMMVSKIEEYIISVEKLQILLVFLDQYIVDQTKYVVAFSLLSAILTRKFNSPEIHPLMNNVAKLAITSELLYIRINCRKVFLQYILDYPIGKQLTTHLHFFISQLGYSETSGRESAIKMLTSMFKVLPQKFVNQNFFHVFIPMTTSLINDSDPTCKKWLANAIKFLFEKLSQSNVKTLFEMLATWLKDHNNNHKRLGSQLCGLFVEVCKDKFGSHMDVVPLLIGLLEPCKYEKYAEDLSKKVSDHLVFQAASSLSKIITACNLVRNPTWQDNLNLLWGYTQKLLLHPHTWVQLTASQLFGTYFAEFTVEEVVQLYIKGNDSQYLIKNLPDKVESLCQDFCKQMDSIEMVPDLGDQIAKNLIYLAKLVLCMENQDLFIAQPAKMNIDRLIKLVTRVARLERKMNKKVASKRMCSFKWIAALAICLGKEKLNEKMNLLLPVLHRELIDKSLAEDSPLRVLTREVVDVMSSVVGVELFSKAFVAEDARIIKRKGKAIKRKAISAVNNPAAKARRKMAKNMLRTAAKKRKSHHTEIGRKIKRMRLAT